MSARRATDKERRKYGKAWMVRRSKPIISVTPPAAPWSVEAIMASDAAALARNLPPMMALNFRRVESGALHGIFDIRVVHWYLTLRSCRWFVKGRTEWVGLPSRQWTDKNGRTHYDENVVIDDVHAARFQDSALEALHRLLARAAMNASEDDQTPQQPLMNGAAVLAGDAGDIPF
jgi:hypothetical protein